VEEVRLSPEDIRGLGEDGLGDKILAGLLHPGGLLSYLHEYGISADQLRQAAEQARTAEKSRGQISSPNTGDGDVAQAAHSARRLVRLSRVLERLADEVACGRAGPAYSLLADGNGLIAQGRRPWVFDISGFSCSTEQRTETFCVSSYRSCRTCPRSASAGTHGLFRSGISPSIATVWLSEPRKMKTGRGGDQRPGLRQ
jgi:hypothetical protein